MVLKCEEFHSWPVHAALLGEKLQIECEGAGDMCGGESAVGKADLERRAGGGYLEHFGRGRGEGTHFVRF